MPKLVCTIAVLLFIAAPAPADSPASIPDTGSERAGAAFDAFAAQWMQRARDTEAQNRAKPTVQPGASSPLVTYRGYADDYALELRPTGNASAPFVGLLRYTELVYTCTAANAESCAVVSSVPVTEIFRYQNGRWHY